MLMEDSKRLNDEYKKLCMDTSSAGLYKLYFHSLLELIKNPERLRFLNAEDRGRLTRNSSEIPPFKEELAGYPRSPLISSIACNLAILTLKGTCPIYKQPSLPHLYEYNNAAYRIDRIQHVVDLLKPIPDMLNYWNYEQFLNRLEIIVNACRKRGLLDLLNLRKTVGSRSVFPFTREEILVAAAEKHCPDSNLSVAGRAVAKHAVRDSTKAWWGECTGTEADKNNKGMTLLERVLDNALWINIHGLPGEVSTLEVRTAQGYGMRCLMEPLCFRGFLEPYKPEGWLDKFSH